MKLKPIVIITVLSLVVASLLISGCTTSTTNQTPSTSSNTTTSAATTHDAFLEKFLAALKTNHTQDSSEQTQVWEVTWINSTSARLEWTELHKATNQTRHIVQTIMLFPTSQDATNFVNAMNKTAYSLNNTVYSTYGAYLNVTGHAPQIYKVYQWEEGNPLSISEYTKHTIELCDNIVFRTTVKVVA